MKMPTTLKQLKRDDQRRKVYAEKVRLAKEEVTNKERNAPSLTDEDRHKVEEMITRLRKLHEYTYFCGAEKERVEELYQKRGKPVPFNQMVAPGNTNIQFKERAYRNSVDLKASLLRLLQGYKTFWYQHPDPLFLGGTTTPKEHAYIKPDKEVLRLYKEVTEMRSYGEQEMYEFTQRGGSPELYIGRFTK